MRFFQLPHPSVYRIHRSDAKEPVPRRGPLRGRRATSGRCGRSRLLAATPASPRPDAEMLMLGVQPLGGRDHDAVPDPARAAPRTRQIAACGAMLQSAPLRRHRFADRRNLSSLSLSLRSHSMRWRPLQPTPRKPSPSASRPYPRRDNRPRRISHRPNSVRPPFPSDMNQSHGRRVRISSRPLPGPRRSANAFR